MIIEISDRLSGKERRKKIVVKTVIYALEKKRTKTEAAHFLGISLRTLRNILYRYDELESYRRNIDWFGKKTDSERAKYLEMLKKYPNK